MATLNQCSSCKGFLPREGNTCPHCGHKSASPSRVAAGLVAAAGIGLALAPGCGGLTGGTVLYGPCLLPDGGLCGAHFETDGGVDAGVDAGVNAGTDGGVDAGTDAGQ